MKGTYIHPLPIRIWHWINAFIVIVLIITGLQLRMPYISIFENYRSVILIHKYFGYAMTISFLFWFFYYMITGGFKKHYLLKITDIKAIPNQVKYYMYGIFKGKKNPHTPSKDNKFNAMQKITYATIMLIFTPVISFTGILFSDILYFFTWINVIGGLRVLDAIHVISAYIFVFYLIVHLYMSTLGKKIYSHTKSMITGYED